MENSDMLSGDLNEEKLTLIRELMDDVNQEEKLTLIRELVGDISQGEKMALLLYLLGAIKQDDQLTLFWTLGKAIYPGQEKFLKMMLEGGRKHKKIVSAQGTRFQVNTSD